MKRRIKNSQTFSNVKLVADDGLIEWFNQLLVSIFCKWPVSLLHVVTDFVSFVTAFLLKNPSLTHAVVPPFRNRSRSSRLFGCKRPHDGSLSLPTFADSRIGASPVPTVVRNYRLTFLRLAKDCKGSNPINNSQKNKGYSKRYTLYSLAESKGFFRRTAVRLRIASLFNHGLSNSPPDCFHRQSRPSLFEALAVLSTKK